MPRPVGWLSGADLPNAPVPAEHPAGRRFGGVRGEIRAAQLVGQIAYEGSTSGAFPGYVSGPLGVVQVAVLDNTGGRMIVYEGTPSLGAPRELGVFVCAWH